METLLKKVIISGQIDCLTGLHIGGSKDNVEIGGIDLPVIKRGIDKAPYIPGSSLKGKLRSLLQKAYGEAEFSQTGSPICALFGATDGKGPNKDKKGNPSRLIVRDAYLTEDSAEELLKSEFTEMPYVEVKFENTINRITGTAEHPRQLERVPAKAKFQFEMVLDIFKNDNEEELISLLKKGIEFLEDDYLGGSGSRGYGQVKFHVDWNNLVKKAIALK